MSCGFPAQWPETYSYTLSAAIDAGLPIVATRIGAFPERLEGRPLTWLVDPEASTEEWLAVFAKVRGELARPRKLPIGKPRKPVADYYREHYVRPPAVGVPDRPVDLRRRDRISVVVIPERFPSGALTPMRVYPAAAAARSSGDRRRLRHRAGRSGRGVELPRRHHRHAALCGGGPRRRRCTDPPLPRARHHIAVRPGR